MAFYKTRTQGYNLREGGLGRGRHSPETCRMMSEKARKYRQEHPWTEDQKKAMRARLLKGKPSLQTRQKKRELCLHWNAAKKGVPKSETGRQKLMLWWASPDNKRRRYFEIMNTRTLQKSITGNLAAFCREHKIGYDRMIAKAIRRVLNTGEWTISRIDPPPVDLSALNR